MVLFCTQLLPSAINLLVVEVHTDMRFLLLLSQCSYDITLVYVSDIIMFYTYTNFGLAAAGGCYIIMLIA